MAASGQEEEGEAHQRTPLLTQQQQTSPRRYRDALSAAGRLEEGRAKADADDDDDGDDDDDDDDDDGVDVEDLQLVRTLSQGTSSSARLGPKPLVSSMLRGKRPVRSRQRRVSMSTRARDQAVPSYGTVTVTATVTTTQGDNGEQTGEEGEMTKKADRAFLIDANYGLFWANFLTTLLCFFVAGFDCNIMSSSHPAITSHFESSNMASFLSTAFMLTNIAVQPLFGRLSDTVGRKGPYVTALTIFTFGTAWCALADSMTSLILARAVGGVGAGGMMTLGAIIISDLVDIDRRATYQSYINVVYGAASASGAALGGWMADTLGWRWEFGVQVFPMLLCLAISLWVMPSDLGLYGQKESLYVAMTSFDLAGSVLLTTATMALVGGLSLGGNVVPWSHPLVIAAAFLFLLSLPSFVYVEKGADRPIIPLAVICSSPRANLIWANLLASGIWNAILFNIPLFFQCVLLTSSTESGLSLGVPVLMFSFGGAMTGILINWTRRLKWPPVMGAVLVFSGLVLMSSVPRDWPIWAYLVCMLPMAAGVGFLFPGIFMAALAVSEQHEQAVVTSTVTLGRALGFVLGIACTSLVVQNTLVSKLQSLVTTDPAVGHDEAWKANLIEHVRKSVETVAKLEGQVQEQVIISYAAAIKFTFICLVAVSAGSVLLLAPIKLPRLRPRER